MEKDERLEMLKSIYEMAYSIILSIEHVSKKTYTKLEKREMIADFLTRKFTERDIDFDWAFTIEYDSMERYYEDATTY